MCEHFSSPFWLCSTNDFRFLGGCQDRAHLVPYVQQTASSCLWQQMNYLKRWTSAWTRRRNWGLGWRNKPQRMCSQTHHFHWIWDALYWWLQNKGINNTFTNLVYVWTSCSSVYCVCVVILNTLEVWSILPCTAYQKMAVLPHMTDLGLVKCMHFLCSCY